MKLIESLIVAKSTSELVMDKLGEILLAESVNQQALASAANQDPRRWAFRVFVNASNPLELFSPGEDFIEQADCPLVVNITFTSKSYDAAKSSSGMRHTYNATYQIDCFARGLSMNDPSGGHIPGDRVAAAEAHRFGALVQQILMAGHHQNIFETKPVIATMPIISDFRVADVQTDNSAIKLAAAPLTVHMNVLEHSPEQQAQIIETIELAVNKKVTGELYFESTIDVSGP